MKEEGETNWLGKCGAITTILMILLLFEGPTKVSAEGNVGCHFVTSVCLEGIEFCYDDLVFGKCLSKAGVEEEDIERQPLTEEQSSIMATMLEEMQGAGLGWDHPFVQCRIQGTLFSMRRNTPLPPNLCANLAPDPEIRGPQSPLAFVRFTPPNDDYADEVYYPPLKKGFDNRIFPSQSFPPSDEHSHMSEKNFEILSELSPPSDLLYPEIGHIIENGMDNDELLNRIKNIKNKLELRRMLEEYEMEKIDSPIYVDNEILYTNNYPNYNKIPMDERNEFKETYKRTHRNFNDLDNMETNEEENELPSTYFREMAKSQHIPLNLDGGHYNLYKTNALESILPVDRVPKEPEDNENESFDGNYYPVSTYLQKYLHKKGPSEPPGVYTEGGLVYVPERNDNQVYDKNEEARYMLANMLGFTRHERLDVKKPGPMVGPPSSAQTDNERSTKKPEEKVENKEVLPAHIKGDSSPKAKKLMSRDHSDDEHAPHTVDTEYAHVILKHPLDNWNDGARIVAALADILHMKSYFTHPRVDRHEVTFRVEENPEKKTAADVARSINDARFKNNISRRLGVTVIRAGVGDKIKSDPEAVSRIEIAEEGQDLTHIIAYMFAGAGAAAVVVILVVLFLIGRHDRKKDKLSGIQAGISGAESCSKDYQELCRARMAGKGPSTSETIASGRITSLTKENDKPPSSRSSTSSWSEEPALTNMDISTGHMVLSYMEDHLRNKGRLQREWEALCGYEAEPSARDAALQTQCAPLNRPGAPLPYDHSRVVLNHLANAEGLDYINASTITDHDPRAPAYIAAQGPLPTTLAHFWQMIWEQGAVVIVALCRLQENGEVVCARYWPEEGAEVYHIYEVHLVSEHIWCDDYLVRSFYLKNLRTSETRTVTQFHFLSWPQSGVPASAKALLEFRRKVNKSYRGRSCPIVVHGSTGAGRTGAYILLDLVLGRMNKGAREIDIAATLEHLRDQRAGLVSTKQQFEFVLMAVAEEVHAILKALPANQGEKRELDKEAVKEEEVEEKPVKGEDNSEKGKEKKVEK